MNGNITAGFGAADCHLAEARLDGIAARPDLVNSLRLTPRGLHSPGDVSISLLTLNSDRHEFDSPPGGWGIVGLWKIDDGTMQADAIDLIVRYNHIASFLPAGDELLTFLTYDAGTWQSLNFDQVKIDSSDHLIRGTLAGSFDYFAVAGPLTVSNSWQLAMNATVLSSIVPESALIIFAPFVCFALSRRRRI